MVPGADPATCPGARLAAGAEPPPLLPPGGTGVKVGVGARQSPVVRGCRATAGAGCCVCETWPGVELAIGMRVGLAVAVAEGGTVAVADGVRVRVGVALGTGPAGVAEAGECWLVAVGAGDTAGLLPVAPACWGRSTALSSHSSSQPLSACLPRGRWWRRAGCASGQRKCHRHQRVIRLPGILS